jgi:16S rRNA G527 N7-methylase RsmG
MVESRSRKAAFLREVVRELTLGDAAVENVRFEVLTSRPRHEATAELVTVRAVRIDEQLVQACRQLLKPGGELIPFGYRGELAPEGFAPGRDDNVLIRCST